MVFPITGGTQSTGYEVSNSLRFNDDDSPKLTFTPSSAGNRRTFTLSVWFKLSVQGSTGERVLLAADDGTGSNNNFDYIAINAADKIFVYNYEGSQGYNLISTQLLRDPSAWYHLVVAFDTTDGTSGNRIKVYLNGNQVTDFDTEAYPSQDFQTRFNNTNAQRISSYPDQNSSYFDGYMCEYHLVDGSQLAPTSFGEFNNNGVWVPIKYTGSHGTNGFYLEFQQTGTSQNSSGIGADTSGNDNHWAVSNLAATDITEDTCTNSFATWNPLDLDLTVTPTLSEGNTQLAQPASGGSSNCNFGVSQGKWYFEWKPTDRDNILLSIAPQNLYPAGSNLFTADKTIGIYAGNPNLYQNGSSQGSLGGGLSNDDIVMYAMDLDNNLLYIGKNGQWNDGLGGGFDQSDFGNANGYSFNREADAFYVVGQVNGSGSSNHTVQMNFGNPPYAVSSSNNDGKYGNFEYSVPSGYYALCTKRLAEFG